MAALEFMFALDLSDRTSCDEMLAEVARNMFGYLGYGGEMTGDLMAQLRAAVSQGEAPGTNHCRVQFSAHAGELYIVVSDSGGREWRTRRPLP